MPIQRFAPMTKDFADLRLRRACHRAAADLGARRRVPDP